MWRAVKIVAVADIVMSLDNIIAIAAVARGNLVLLVIGLAVSIPIILAGAALFMALLDRFPILVWAGAALLGWVAGDIMADRSGSRGLLDCGARRQRCMVDRNRRRPPPARSWSIAAGAFLRRRNKIRTTHLRLTRAKPLRRCSFANWQNAVAHCSHACAAFLGLFFARNRILAFRPVLSCRRDRFGPSPKIWLVARCAAPARGVRRLLASLTFD